MRPINKGDWPKENGDPVNFIEYGDARPYLITRIGDYCSYCENQITNPAVEHEQPKKVAPGIEKNWYNLLLSCVNCNSIKGHGCLNIDSYYWPDIHNTSLLFDFYPFGAVTVKPSLHPSVDPDKCQRTLELTGLNLYGTTTSSADRRWIKRSQAYGKAEDAFDYYVNHNRPADFIPIIRNTALSTGFWSVWITVFLNEFQVIMALKNAFPNTFEYYDITDINRV